MLLVIFLFLKNDVKMFHGMLGGLPSRRPSIYIYSQLTRVAYELDEEEIPPSIEGTHAQV
jgi:hypothetical protein